LAQHGARPRPMPLPVCPCVFLVRLSCQPVTAPGFWLDDAESTAWGGAAGGIYAQWRRRRQVRWQAQHQLPSIRPLPLLPLRLLGLPNPCLRKATLYGLMEYGQEALREWRRSWLRLLSEGLQGLLLIRTCPHFGVSRPVDLTRVRAKDNLKLLMLVNKLAWELFGVVEKKS